jgi:crotonobetainyl-CoA:carnitine CoA-transferase CaiB-like acyl-CoA transferase
VLLDTPELADRQYDEDQEGLAAALAGVFAERALADWLERFGDEDVCVGPVWTRAEAASAFGLATQAELVPLGAHTEAWRRELGVG